MNTNTILIIIKAVSKLLRAIKKGIIDSEVKK